MVNKDLLPYYFTVFFTRIFYRIYTVTTVFYPHFYRMCIVFTVFSTVVFGRHCLKPCIPKTLQTYRYNPETLDP